MANLLVTMLDHVGVPIAKVGDSTGQLLLDYGPRGRTRRAACGGERRPTIVSRSTASISY